MSIWSRFKEWRNNPLENPATPISSALNAIFGWAFGGNATASGEVINEHTALQHVTVYSCVRVLAEAVGSLTCRTYQRLPKGRSEATEDPIWRMLSLTPNTEMSAAVLWENVVGCMALTGNSYVEIIRDKSKQPTQLYPLPSLKTDPVRLPTGVLAYRTQDYATGGTRIIAAVDCLHFRLWSWDGLKGLSPIAQARQTIGWSQAAIKQSARQFGNGSTSPGILTPVGDKDEQEIINFRQAYELANAGENAGRTAVLPNDWKWQATGINAKDAQFLESMQFSRTDIASLMRVPAHMVGDNTKMSNNNVEGMNLSFVIDSLRPYLVKIEQEIIIKLLGADNSRFVEFDTSDRLRGDFKSTMEGFAVGKQWGIFTTNYCLEQLGENPIGPEGDILWAPVNMQNAKRMMDTESIQDQPVGGDPTPQVRSLFTTYGTPLLSIYKDAVGRVATRSKRDAESVTPILAPVLETITTLVEMECRTQFGLDESWHASDKSTREYLKAVTTRATEWKPETRDQVAGDELGKAMRSLCFSIYREAGAALAEKGLTNA